MAHSAIVTLDYSAETSRNSNKHIYFAPSTLQALFFGEFKIIANGKEAMKINKNISIRFSVMYRASIGKIVIEARNIVAKFKTWISNALKRIGGRKRMHNNRACIYLMNKGERPKTKNIGWNSPMHMTVPPRERKTFVKWFRQVKHIVVVKVVLFRDG